MIVGITGKTGSGKTTAADVFRARGIPVLDADAIYRTLSVEPDVQRQLMDAFGAAVVRDGALDRRALAAIVFADPQQLTRLNALVHPLIMARMNDEIAALLGAGHSIVAVDASHLFEAGYDKRCDVTVYVRASESVRLRRIIARDGLDEQAARARADAHPGGEPPADIILDNDTDEQTFRARVGDLINDLQKDKHTHG